MDVFYAYTYGTAAWLALQAAPMIISPQMIVTLLSPEVREASTLETYFSRSFGITLITVGILCILLTGSVPLSSRFEPGAVTTEASDPKAPYAVPTLSITLTYHAIAGFYSYMLWTETGVFSYALGVVGSTIFAAIGLWCVLFASSEGRISRRTGADKRTSGFPFKNSEAERRKSGKKL